MRGGPPAFADVAGFAIEEFEARYRELLSARDAATENER